MAGTGAGWAGAQAMDGLEAAGASADLETKPGSPPVDAVLSGRPEAKIAIHRQGAEGHPVIVIDDFAPDPEAIVEEAARHTYKPIGPYFPGLRSPTPPALVSAAREALLALIQETFDLDQPLNRIESYFSLIVTPPGELEPLQRLPHFDGLGPRRIAMVHHLSRAERGGTAFYRHRSTGFESMDEARLPAYNLAVNREVARHGLPANRYIDADSPIYEQIGRHRARYNRLLIYRGNTLHGADVPDDAPLTADPRTGRFSINTFIWLEP